MAGVGLDEHVGRVLGQRYRLVAPVGTGASARVYLAEDTTLRRRVAVKLLHGGLATDARFRKRFRAEARSSAQLSHPNIMAVFDWSEPDDGDTTAPAYLVTELLTGGSLRSMLDAGHRLSLSQALIVGLHTAEGLAYAHYNGFVHRDIKPANLLFGAEGRLRIADFGIARAVAEAAWTEPEGALVGTARYAAPEQASGSSIDGRADVYALAVTLVEAVTGSVPLTAPTPLATMVLRQDTDLLVPGALGPLTPALRAAGRAQVDERSTAEEFAAALRSAASLLPRPQKLPLTGLDRDPRDSGDRTTSQRPPVHVAETGILVLDGGHASIDVSDLPPSPDDQPDEVMQIDHADPLVLSDDDLEVVEEIDDRRRQWPILLLLLVLVLGAVVAYRGREGQGGSDAGAGLTHPVGTYVGRTFDEAVADIERNSWVYVTTSSRLDGSEVGDVIEQSPQPGVELQEGLEITLVVSEGPSFRVVPNLEGLQLEAALAELATVGLFLGSTGERYDENASDFEVISASIQAGVEVEAGSKVDLLWSIGPAPRTIPDFEGLLLEDAQVTLDELALSHVVIEEFSQTVIEGRVVRTEPSVGSTVERGGDVTIVVSLGLPFVEVPNVVGVSAADAADVLTGAGFVVVDTVGPPNSEVLATDPPAGEAHRQGTEIIIFTRR